MRWSEVDLVAKLWTIPAERMKSKRPHEVPLSSQAAALLEALPRFSGDYVFTTRAGRPISGFGKAKTRFDKAMAKLREDLFPARNTLDPLPSWRLHDLRRNVRTGLGALPIPFEIRELVVAHLPPTLTRTYDLHQYREEKRNALELWGRHLKEIVAALQ